MNFLPGVPYWVLAMFFAVFFTLLNCSGIETSARINAGMAAAMGLVIVACAGRGGTMAAASLAPGGGVFRAAVLRSRDVQHVGSPARDIDCGA